MSAPQTKSDEKTVAGLQHLSTARRIAYILRAIVINPFATIGVGTLRTTGGDVLLTRARYILKGTGERVEGDILNPPEPWGFAGPLIGTAAVLVLADGRSWECVLMNHHGHLKNRGGRGLFHDPA